MDRVQFMASVHEALGPGCTISDFAEDEPTPEFDYCANEDQDSFEENPGEILPPTPKMNDNYVGARVQLPRGNYMT